MQKKINSALISVFDKTGLEPIVRLLHLQGVKIYSTGGTYSFIEELGVPVASVESVTGFPSVFGGRVKTLHPKIFGGILFRRQNESDIKEAAVYEVPAFDMVVVDLYPFEQTVAAGSSHEDIIEKIDIGGISLIRAAAKNYQDVLVVSSRSQYEELCSMLEENYCQTSLEDRLEFAAAAFDITSHYDTLIFNYFNTQLPENKHILHYKESIREVHFLRYGENPHQRGAFFGDLGAMFEQFNGKELSYNNLVDIDAAIHLIAEFEKTSVAIIKHTNACGVASADSVSAAYQKALAADPVSAFGGIIIANRHLDLQAATAINELFFEILIAPSYQREALELLSLKKNRIILRQKSAQLPLYQYKTLLNGVIGQEKDLKTVTARDLKFVTELKPTPEQIESLLFANKIVKHTKSNTIVLAVDGQLLASGTGQTSRVDALKQAIHKAKTFGFELGKAVMASDAFFPFADCVEIAHSEGIKAVIQPGGSIKDKDSIEFCDQSGMTMVFTGIRHFRH
jgi:phosphoribosylaminoimidazolecarboxamide formyltransferase/IMP cyclohydrolase